MPCPDEIVFFFCKCGRFFAIFAIRSSVMMHYILLLLFIFLKIIDGYTSATIPKNSRHKLPGQWKLLCLSRSRSTYCNPLLWLFGLSSQECSGGSKFHLLSKLTQEMWLVVLKPHQKDLEYVHSNVFVIQSEPAWQPTSG